MERAIDAAGLMRSAVAAARIGLDAITPPLCPITNERVSAPGVLAARAWSKLRFIDDPVCARCGAPFSHDVGAGAQCAACIADPPDFDSARAAVLYDDDSHGLIVAFKHADRTDLAPLLAQWLARGIGTVQARRPSGAGAAARLAAVCAPL